MEGVFSVWEVLAELEELFVLGFEPLRVAGAVLEVCVPDDGS